MKSTSLVVITEDNRFNRRLTKFQCYLTYFFIFSFVGWLLETIYSYFVLGYFANRGFLFGPLCPIYGFGGLILIIFLEDFKKHPVQLFFVAIIVFSIFEYIIGYGLDALYNLWLWDYRNEFLNINGRICLFYSIAWGVVALVFNYILFPIFKNFLTFLSTKIPIKLQIFVIRLCTMIFIVDVLYSLIQYSSF